MNKFTKTFTGELIDVFDPKCSQICIEDIACGLSKMPRWAGQTHKAYSVASHSLWVMEQADDDDKLEALLHDSTEAYLMDMPSPIKNRLPDYLALEMELDQCIRKRFKLPDSMSENVHKIDKRAIQWERDNIMSDSFIPMSASAVEKAFLGCFYMLIANRDHQIIII